VGLAIRDQRIDVAADIVDRGTALDRHAAGVRIDLDLTDRRPVRQAKLTLLNRADVKTHDLEKLTAHCYL